MIQCPMWSRTSLDLLHGVKIVVHAQSSEWTLEGDAHPVPHQRPPSPHSFVACPEGTPDSSGKALGLSCSDPVLDRLLHALHGDPGRRTRMLPTTHGRIHAENRGLAPDDFRGCRGRTSPQGRAQITDEGMNSFGYRTFVYNCYRSYRLFSIYWQKIKPTGGWYNIPIKNFFIPVTPVTRILSGGVFSE